MTNYECLLFVIPNAVRNLVRRRKKILRFALNDRERGKSSKE